MDRLRPHVNRLLVFPVRGLCLTDCLFLLSHFLKRLNSFTSTGRCCPFETMAGATAILSFYQEAQMWATKDRQKGIELYNQIGMSFLLKPCHVL